MAKPCRKQWQTVPAAARRLGRNAGHLRKLCAAWEARGLARRVRGTNTKWHWEIHRRAGLTATAGRPAKGAPGSTIVIRLPGGITIQISRGGMFEGGSNRASNDI